MALLKVKTEGGYVQGQPSANQRNSLFKGIPYAAPPVGALRWKAPQPVIPWDGVLDCSKWPKICPQEHRPSEGGDGSEFIGMLKPETSEDCLYLNIWTPAKDSSEKLPVAVYIHGGGLQAGYSYVNHFDGDGFCKRGVILVTINYRLNLFGYLAHPELTLESPHKASGNYGTMDQAAAIHWVKRNIAEFGGDPDCISVFGQSGGADAVLSMCTTKLTKGIIKRAVMQSAGAMMVGLIGRSLPLSEAEQKGVEFFDYVGAKNLAEARAMDAEFLEASLIKYNKEVMKGTVGLGGFSPNVDGYVMEEDRLELLRKGLHHDLDYMVGCTSQEMWIDEPKVPPVEAVRKDAERLFGDLADKYLEQIRPQDTEYAKQFFQNPMGEGMLAADLAWCENQLVQGMKPAYMYYFTLVPPGAKNAHHSAEHHYVFQTLLRSNRPYGGRDLDLSNMLAGYWANFMKTGNPNGGGLPEWKPYTKESPKALELKYEPEMVKVPEKANVKFMKDFALQRIK